MDGQVPDPFPPPLSLSFSDAVTVLMTACGSDPEARSAFGARVRQLQRLGVPAGQDSKATRLRYGIPELAALATAMKLMDAFMVPALAARYVVERWPELVPFVLAGTRAALPKSYLARRSVPSDSFAVFGGNALRVMGKRHRHDQRYVAELGSVRVVDEKLAGAAVSGGAALVIDSGSYMPVIVHQWAERLATTDIELQVELDRLRLKE